MLLGGRCPGSNVSCFPILFLAVIIDTTRATETTSRARKSTPTNTPSTGVTMPQETEEEGVGVTMGENWTASQLSREEKPCSVKAVTQQVYVAGCWFGAETEAIVSWTVRERVICWGLLVEVEQMME